METSKQPICLFRRICASFSLRNWRNLIWFCLRIFEFVSRDFFKICRQVSFGVLWVSNRSCVLLCLFTGAWKKKTQNILPKRKHFGCFCFWRLWHTVVISFFVQSGKKRETCWFCACWWQCLLRMEFLTISHLDLWFISLLWFNTLRLVMPRLDSRQTLWSALEQSQSAFPSVILQMIWFQLGQTKVDICFESLLFFCVFGLHF